MKQIILLLLVIGLTGCGKFNITPDNIQQQNINSMSQEQLRHTLMVCANSSYSMCQYAITHYTEFK